MKTKHECPDCGEKEFVVWAKCMAGFKKKRVLYCPFCGHDLRLLILDNAEVGARRKK